jgi:hypothetical protein
MRDQTIFARPDERFAIPLDEAWYCESCHVILNNSACFCCASAEHTQRLAPWLNREPEPIHLPMTGVFLSVIPGSRKPPQESYFAPQPQELPRAS